MGGQIEYIEEQLRQWRGLKRLVETHAYEHFYIDLTIEEQAQVLEFIISGKYDSLRQWMQDVKSKTLEGQSIEVLRKMAAEAKIPYYNALSKRQLIYKIRKGRRDEFNRDTTQQIDSLHRRLEAERQV